MFGTFNNRPLDCADIHCLVHNSPSAKFFAGVLADERTCARERIVFADKPHSIGIAAFLAERYISRDIHMRRAVPCASHRLMLCQAGAGSYMHFVIFVVCLGAAQNNSGGLEPDCAIGAVGDYLRGFSQELDIVVGSRSVQYLYEQQRHLLKPDPARSTLAAALRLAQAQKYKRQVNGANPPLPGGHAPFKPGVDILDCFLAGMRGFQE